MTICIYVYIYYFCINIPLLLLLLLLDPTAHSSNVGAVVIILRQVVSFFWFSLCRTWRLSDNVFSYDLLGYSSIISNIIVSLCTTTNNNINDCLGGNYGTKCVVYYYSHSSLMFILL